MPPKFDAALDAVLDADARYARASYHFLRDVLERLQYSLPGCRGRQGAHVDARELLEELRSEAAGQFGPMALAVLEEWGIRSWEDWGEVAFRLMAHGIVECGPGDCRDDFRGRVDFATAFSTPVDPPANPGTRSRRSVRTRRPMTDTPAPVG